MIAAQFRKCDVLLVVLHAKLLTVQLNILILESDGHHHRSSKFVNLAVFDVDGTLLQNHSSEDECYAAALRHVLGLRAIDLDWAKYRAARCLLATKKFLLPNLSEL